MIITIPFLCILAFFVLIFAMRVRVTVEMKEDSDLALTVTVLGINIKILPKKPKKYNIKNYTPKKIAKRDKKAAEKAEKKRIAAAKKKAEKAEKKKQKKEAAAKLTKAEKKAIKARKKAKRPPIPDMLSLFLRVIKILFSGLFSKFHFHVARLRIKVGSSDAATTALMYVAICQAINPVLNFLAKHSNLHGRGNADIDVSPDYLSEELKVDIKLGFSTSLGGLLGALFRTGFSFIFGWMKIVPSVPEHTLPPMPPKPVADASSPADGDGRAKDTKSQKSKKSKKRSK